MMRIPVDEHIPESARREVQRMISVARSKRQKVRVARIHAEDFARIVDVIVARMPVPFMPTLCGIPLEPWERAELGVFAVADDDTPLSIDHVEGVREEIR
jgi:hypothetical protein